MKTIFILLTTIFFAVTANVQAQRVFSSFNNDKLIQSLDDVLYVVNQEYALRGPDDQLYGSDGREHFGSAYGPAILWDGHLILNRHNYQPYLRDTSFRSFGENYVPEPTKTYIQKVGHSSFLRLNEEPAYTFDNAVYIPLSDSLSVEHDFVTEETTTMDCVVITFITSDDEITQNSRFRYNYINTTVTWPEDSAGLIDEQSLGTGTRFGLLFYEYRKPGFAGLILGGFVEKNPDGKWVALPVTELDTDVIAESESDQSRRRRFIFW